MVPDFLPTHNPTISNGPPQSGAPLVRPSVDPSFYQNLAFSMPDSLLTGIGYDTVDLTEQDDDQRAVWKQIITQTVDLIGSPLGKSNQGASMPRETSFNSPTLRQAILSMSCKIHQTLFPAGEWVRSSIMGLTNKDNEDRADRISAYMNYYLTKVAKEYKSDKELLLFWYVICGCAFSKTYIDPLKNRPIAPYIHPEDIVISPEATCLEDAERIAHRFTLSDRNVHERIRVGIYKDVNLQEDYAEKGGSIQARAQTKAGITPQLSHDHKNKQYTFYESMRWLSLPGDEFARSSQRKLLPYLVTVDKNSKKVVSLNRNWDPHDSFLVRKNPYTQYKLFSGFGPYGMGMAHLALDLARAETQMMKELVRAAELSNQPSMFFSATALKNERTQIDLNPGSVNRLTAIDGNINNAMTVNPTKEPSQTLLALKGQVTEAITNLSTARELLPQNIPANTTATTMMGILSTFHILEDSVMNRLYDSFSNELGLLYTLLGEWLPDTPYPFAVPGADHVLLKQDFGPDVSISPSVDANISSQTFQLIVNEAILTLVQAAPDLYDIRSVHERALRSMKISDIDAILKPLPPEGPPPPPPALDPVSENQAVLIGTPIKVYKWQDHAAHKSVHEDLMQQIAKDETKAQALAALNAHVAEHDAFAWAQDIQGRMGFQIPDDGASIPPEAQTMIAQKAAEAIVAKQQEAQAAAGPPPPDPNAVLLEDIKMKKEQNELRHQIDQQKLAIEQAKMERDSQEEQARLQMQSQKIEAEQAKLEREAEEERARLMMELKKMEREQAEAEREQQVEQETRAQEAEDLHQKAEQDRESDARQREQDNQKMDLERAKLDLEREKLKMERENLQTQAQIDYTKMQEERRSVDLDAENKSYDTTLKFESSQNKEPGISPKEEDADD